MVNKLKNAFIILGMTSALVYYLMCPQWQLKTSSYSGSLDVLSKNGTVTVMDGVLMYTDWDSFLSTDEIQALNTLSKMYQVAYGEFESEINF